MPAVLMVFFLVATLVSRTLSADGQILTWQPPVSILKLGVEIFCFLSAMQVAAAIQCQKLSYGPSSQGAVKLASYIVLPLQAILLASTMHNLPYFLQTETALKNYETAKIEINGSVLLIDGAIGKDTSVEVLAYLTATNLTRIALRSPGGLIDEALKISQVVKSREISVQVVDHCESSCVIIASASPNLTATPNSQFGFHRGSSLVSTDSSLSKYTSEEATTKMLAALKENGVPNAILEVAQQTEPGDMYYVSAEKMLSLGIVRNIQQ